MGPDVSLLFELFIILTVGWPEKFVQHPKTRTRSAARNLIPAPGQISGFETNLSRDRCASVHLPVLCTGIIIEPLSKLVPRTRLHRI